MRRNTARALRRCPGPDKDAGTASLDGQLTRGVVPALAMPAALVLGDLLVMACVWTFSVHLRLVLGGTFSPAEYLDLAPAALIHIVLNAFLGSYSILLSEPIELKKCTMGTLLFVLIFTATTFWARTPYAYSRGIMLIGGLLLLLAIPIGRLTLRAWCARFAWWGYRTVFYVHKDYDLDYLKRVFHSLSSCLQPALVIFHEHRPARPEPDLGVPVLSGQDWLKRCECRHPDAVFVYLTRSGTAAETAKILSSAERLFGRIIILHESLNLGNLWATTVDIGNMLGLEAMQRLLDRKRMFIKTATDLVISLLLLLAMLPLFALIMLAIWLEKPGPLFYAHRRIGRGGTEFFAYKFRTMYPNSESILQAALERDPALRRQWEEHRKLANDPRITEVGRFLRRSSLDELPQLVNVLRGEMSLIGPRPIMDEEIHEYQGHFPFVNQVRPGLTGLWQVSGRSRLTYAERVGLDMYYIRNWSFWLDMVILIKTPAAVLDFSGTA